jgi:hypothetical protein
MKRNFVLIIAAFLVVTSLFAKAYFYKPKSEVTSNVYYYTGSTCILLDNNNVSFTTSGSGVQATITDVNGNSYYLYSDSNCSTAVYYEF